MTTSVRTGGRSGFIAPPTGSHAVLEEIQRRVLWLAVRTVDIANRERPNRDGIKVGGHQASSASVVTLLTVLWFHHLRSTDYVSVKPHASPVLHAIQYLLGNLDRSYLSELRAYKGLQAYPSRTKDPDPVDYSTGSVGLGAVAPLFGAVTHRYLEHHGLVDAPARFISVVGDAELDEGNVWEALADPVTGDLGSAMWVVDLNRQSLDRVVPGIRAAYLMRMFDDVGWQVVEAKYGRLLEQLFACEGGEAVRKHIDDMTNERYQSLFRLRGAELREAFLHRADPMVGRVIAEVGDDELPSVLFNLGGHDIPVMMDAYERAAAETERPSVVFAYTVKGWGLPMAGDRLNHSALLTGEQIDELRAEVGLTPDTELARFAPGSDAGEMCRQVAERLQRPASASEVTPAAMPAEVGVSSEHVSTQEAFGRILLGLGRTHEVGQRLVTVSPDVAVSTGLGGWINKAGVFSHRDEESVVDEGLLRWVPGPAGQHFELGISEMNLFVLLGQLGLSHDLHGQRLLPIGTVYDPFVCRGLDAFIYSAYTGARFIVVGTPSGITLSPEGGAHQSTITGSIGMELPGVTMVEPAYAQAFDWLLCDAIRRLGEPDGEAAYFRLTTRAIDQTPFHQARRRLGDEQLYADVLAGGYRLLEATGDADAPLVHLFACGAVMPETVAAAEQLRREGVRAHVVDVTSADRLYRDWKGWRADDVRTARARPGGFQLARLLPPGERGAPIVTVHDAHSHALAWLGSVFGAPTVPVGVDRFGESGTLDDLYGAHGLRDGAIVNAALLSLEAAADRT